MEHPITPPPELVQQWDKEAAIAAMPDQIYIATQAARWGADQELKACCEWLAQETPEPYISALRTSRRPKTPSLKQQALKMLAPHSNPVMPGTPEYRLYEPQVDIIRRALESLPDPQD